MPRAYGSGPYDAGRYGLSLTLGGAGTGAGVSGVASAAAISGPIHFGSAICVSASDASAHPVFVIRGSAIATMTLGVTLVDGDLLWEPLPASAPEATWTSI